MASVGIVVVLVVIMSASSPSVLSEVSQGIKWLPSINMVHSISLLGIFILFGATWFGVQAIFVGLWAYVLGLTQHSFKVLRSDGVDGSEPFNLAKWKRWLQVFHRA